MTQTLVPSLVWAQETDRSMELQSLLKQAGSRAFLKRALELQYPAGVNLADFSRRARFSSRSFLSLYLSGKKGLSQNSLNKINSALKLPKDYKRYFSYLTALEQPSLAKDLNLKGSLEGEIESLRVLLSNQDRVRTRIRSTSELLSMKELFVVFASLGSESKGANLSEILTKSRLPEKVVLQSLQVLTEQSLVERKGERYYATNATVDLFHLKSSNLAQLVKSVCSDIHRNAQSIVDDSGNLILYFALSVEPQRRLAFKEKLRDAVCNVLDEFQNDDGACVEQLFVCLRL